ncbi:6410_t:CDS:1 [Paraglomus occultum]|uniref:6410_t:CDS:1 n=1 Tax=Paraglomus occultum TaxID=144539 RepID=A0A9N8Z0P9_9GLOM|nr:6410_t:CDS:1 [Paraglomus occultum]
MSHIFNEEILLFISEQNLLTKEVMGLLDNPPLRLALPIQELVDPTPRSRKQLRSKRIPRCSNAWIMYRRNLNAIKNEEKGSAPRTKQTLQAYSKEAKRLWENEGPTVKRFFEVLSELARQVHKRKYPDYKYTPREKKGKTAKPKDEGPGYVFFDGVKEWREPIEVEEDHGEDIDASPPDVQLPVTPVIGTGHRQSLYSPPGAESWEMELQSDSFEDLSFEDLSFEDLSFEDLSFEDLSFED